MRPAMTRAIGRADERSVSRLPGARRISVRVAAKLRGSTAAAAGAAAARTEERINLLEDAEREDTGGDPSNTLTDGERFRMYGEDGGLRAHRTATDATRKLVPKQIISRRLWAMRMSERRQDSMNATTKPAALSKKCHRQRRRHRATARASRTAAATRRRRRAPSPARRYTAPPASRQPDTHLRPANRVPPRETTGALPIY
jgi:hypothetical protein